MILVFLIIWALFGYLGGKVVARKGYEPKFGIALGLLGWIGLLVALLLPMTQAGRELQALEFEIEHAPKRANCPNCGQQIPFGSTDCPHCQYVIQSAPKK